MLLQKWILATVTIAALTNKAFSEQSVSVESSLSSTTYSLEGGYDGSFSLWESPLHAGLSANYSYTYDTEINGNFTRASTNLATGSVFAAYKQGLYPTVTGSGGSALLKGLNWYGGSVSFAPRWETTDTLQEDGEKYEIKRRWLSLSAAASYRMYSLSSATSLEFPTSTTLLFAQSGGGRRGSGGGTGSGSGGAQATSDLSQSITQTSVSGSIFLRPVRSAMLGVSGARYYYEGDIATVIQNVSTGSSGSASFGKQNNKTQMASEALASVTTFYNESLSASASIFPSDAITTSVAYSQRTYTEDNTEFRSLAASFECEFVEDHSAEISYEHSLHDEFTRTPELTLTNTWTEEFETTLTGSYNLAATSSAWLASLGVSYSF
jgi:hypothetical protein